MKPTSMNLFIGSTVHRYYVRNIMIRVPDIESGEGIHSVNIHINQIIEYTLSV